jgi:hypothetical protein
MAAPIQPTYSDKWKYIKMNANVHLWQYLADLFLERDIF